MTDEHILVLSRWNMPVGKRICAEPPRDLVKEPLSVVAVLGVDEKPAFFQSVGHHSASQIHRFDEVKLE